MHPEGLSDTTSFQVPRTSSPPLPPKGLLKQLTECHFPPHDKGIKIKAQAWGGGLHLQPQYSGGRGGLGASQVYTMKSCLGWERKLSPLTVVFWAEN